MKLIVGLGNPGEKYSKQRHNVGFMILDQFAKEENLSWEDNSKLKSKMVKLKDTVLMKPQTFMNNSGDAVYLVSHFYKISPEDITVIHDDVDLPFGEIKNQFNVGPAGHHGVEDIILKLGTKEFNRIRVGIGRPENINIPVDEYVLMNFSDNELLRILELGRGII
ncbi:aminoacyl-tRNA hydrolase, partial [Patescibacteria group bacterium]|nr:aminoacyl-tRNA hydrolase [Patescibacteria group bacterium]